MNTRNVLFVFALLASGTTAAQDRNDVFRKDVPVTWLGLDLSQAKLIGDRERFGSESDVRHLIDAWNELILKEPDKYDVAKAIGRIKVENGAQVTMDHNTEADVMSMFSEDEKDYLHVTQSDVDGIVANYDLKEFSGVGLVFIIESFSKKAGEGSVWVTFIDMGSKQVLFAERVAGEPGGAGMRNFWGGAIYSVITKIKKKEFELWRKKYYRP